MENRLTENHIFLCQLKGSDIFITANEITEDEIQLLFKHKIILPLAPNHLNMRSLAVANYTIQNGIDAFPDPTYIKRNPGDHVILRQKIHADNK